MLFLGFLGAAFKHGASLSNPDHQTHVAACQLSVSSSTDHVCGHQIAPPVISGAGGVVDHWEEGLLQDVSNGTSSFGRELSI